MNHDRDLDVFFWQNMPSHLQSPAIDALAQVWPGTVHCVWESEISDQRAAMSWAAPEMPNTTQIYLDQQDPHGFAKRLVSDYVDAIHIFSGMDSYPAITSAFLHAKREGAKRLGMMAEPGIALGWRGRLRPLRAKILARRYIKDIGLVLASGQTGVRFYRRAGFNEKIVFPYMYQAPVGNNEASKHPSDSFSLIYIGKFEARKGVDTLLRAVTHCRTAGIKLRIIGGGLGEQKMRALCSRLGLDEIVCWEGVRTHDEVMALLRESDLCVVPSRFEGWGVVVNEAIGMGTPVVCSSGTTSRDLVQYGDCGRVFNSGDEHDLASKIDELLLAPAVLVSAAENARQYRHRLAPVEVASYLKSVLEFAFLGLTRRPTPPWEVEPGSVPSALESTRHAVD